MDQKATESLENPMHRKHSTLIKLELPRLLPLPKHFLSAMKEFLSGMGKEFFFAGVINSVFCLSSVGTQVTGLKTPLCGAGQVPSLAAPGAIGKDNSYTHYFCLRCHFQPTPQHPCVIGEWETSVQIMLEACSKMDPR